jgi:hypothetical protein
MRRFLSISIPIVMASVAVVPAAPSQTNPAGVIVFTNARILSAGPGIQSIQTPAMSIVVRDGKVAELGKGLNPGGLARG